MERLIIEAQKERSRSTNAQQQRGQWFGFSIGIVGLLVGGAVAILNPTTAGATAGSAIGGITLVGLVGVFIAGRNAKSLPKNTETED